MNKSLLFYLKFDFCYIIFIICDIIMRKSIEHIVLVITTLIKDFNNYHFG